MLFTMMMSFLPGNSPQTSELSAVNLTSSWTRLSTRVEKCGFRKSITRKMIVRISATADQIKKHFPAFDRFFKPNITFIIMASHLYKPESLN